MFCLESITDPAWTELVISQVDRLLVDHAYCEKKAAATALSLIGKYPDDTFLVPHLLALAHEELEHFERLYSLLVARGIPLGHVDKDPYVGELLPLARKQGVEGLIDRLLISSLIEARSAERFFLLADALPDPELRALYADLSVTESRHHTLFVTLAQNYAPKEIIRARLKELASAEAAIVARLPIAARMH
jgi:tRNA-(ms[2]io[6]A)-hydroxylase